jgi:hypothetical protein
MGLPWTRSSLGVFGTLLGTMFAGSGTVGADICLAGVSVVSALGAVRCGNK